MLGKLQGYLWNQEMKLNTNIDNKLNVGMWREFREIFPRDFHGTLKNWKLYQL